MIQKAHKYRCYPNPKQQTRMNQTFGCVRKYWNILVDCFNNFIDPKTEKEYRQEFLYMKDVSAAALQQKRRDCDETKRQFYDKKRKVQIGKMQFKKKGKTKDSYRLPNQKFKIDQENSRIYLEKIGWVPVAMDRPIPENAKLFSVTVSRHPSNQYYVSIQFEIESNPLPLTGNHIGLDFGLKDLFAASNGLVAKNPTFFRKNQARLRKEQKALSRKVFGSNRYHKQKRKVARVHKQIADSRSYYLHNLTTRLVREYDLICVENLNVAGMKRKFGKSASDASISEAIRQLEYKSLWYGKTLVKIDQWFPSTQLCSGCGTKCGPKGLEGLSVREWECNGCGAIHQRDHNAARNILMEGYRVLTNEQYPNNMGSNGPESVEYTDYKHGGSVGLKDWKAMLPSQMQDSMKCLLNGVS